MTSDTTPQPARAPDLVDLVVDYVTSLAPALTTQREQIEQDLRAEFGGESHYVQARVEKDRQRRAREVLALFNGRNATEVARRLNLSRASVYRYIKQPGPATPAPEQKPAPAATKAKRLSQPTPTAETAPQIG
jgi:Mor transcription activator family